VNLYQLLSLDVLTRNADQWHHERQISDVTTNCSARLRLRARLGGSACDSLAVPSYFSQWRSLDAFLHSGSLAAYLFFFVSSRPPSRVAKRGKWTVGPAVFGGTK
jgi:hypothetical protein